MPGFASVLGAAQRWDLVDFIRARAAGALSQLQGPAITAAAAYPIPDFAFERGGRQQTLSALLKHGPVLLVLFRPPAPDAVLARLAAARRPFTAAGLAVVPVDLVGTAEAAPASPAVRVASDVAASLVLFMPAGPGPVALMLDRAGNVRARWTAEGPVGFPDPADLAGAASRVARFPAATASHAGHGG